MEHEIALHFRDQLRAARAAALRDAEGFHEIIVAVERLGAHLSGRIQTLGRYRNLISQTASGSPMAEEVPAHLPDLHTSFEIKYEMVREARNSALHEGALARHLTANAVELSLVLEEALMRGRFQVGDFMVRNPVCASLWQPLSFIRQTMLVNSFSFLPILPNGDGTMSWQLISDFHLAQYLRQDGAASKERLVQDLRQAAKSGLDLLPAATCCSEDTVEKVLRGSKGLPVVVLSCKSREIVGIITAFDFL